MSTGGPPAQLPPGTPLPGGSGVAGVTLYSWTLPPQVVWEGWIATGEVFDADGQWPGLQLTAVAQPPPATAGPPPEGGGTWTVVRVVPPGGWLSDLLW
jgi:hypothetical protein